MTNNIDMSNIEILSHLFQKKEEKLGKRIANLQISDVSDDKVFKETIKKIKEEILLTPVIFEEPQPSSHNIVADGYEVVVNFLFKGSQELFQYRVNKAVSVSNRKVFQPQKDNVIAIKVIVKRLEKEETISEAKKKMGTTFSIINAQKQEVQDWSKKMASTIDTTLQQKRKELVAFYE